MARKPATPPKPQPSSLKPLMGAVAAGGLLVLLYLTITWLGQQAGEAVADRPRYRVKFEDLDCPTPPGMDRATFLAEVRYLARPPREFSLMDETALEAVARAFACHPWVAAAEVASPRPMWPAAIRLSLRKPLLAVAVSEGPWPERVVDDQGVLLPATTSTADLSRLASPQPPPVVPPGQPWTNPLVRRAVELARDYNPALIEKTASGWRVTERGGRVLLLDR